MIFQNRMKLLAIVFVCLGLLLPAIRAEELKSISIQDALQTGKYSLVVNAVANSSPEDILKSSHVLNDFISKLPDDQAITLSELLAKQMSADSPVKASDKDWSIAYAAVVSNSLEMLTKSSKDLPLKSMKDSGGKGLLTWSIINGSDPDIVRFLIEAGCNVNEQDAAGNTPLLWLYLSGHGKESPIRQLLIKNGADNHLKNKVGLSPFSFSEKK